MKKFTVCPGETKDGVTNQGVRLATVMLWPKDGQRFHSNLGEIKFGEQPSNKSETDK